MTRKWRADLETLFAEAGNIIQHGSGDRVESGHEPKHSSSSGTCVLIDAIEGRWYCRSCKKGGDAVTFVRDLKGCGYEEAVAYLTDRFGPPIPDNDASDPEAWENPLPLLGPPPPTFPADVLPPVFRDFVRAEATATQTPLDLCGSLTLATLST